VKPAAVVIVAALAAIASTAAIATVWHPSESSPRAAPDLYRGSEPPSDIRLPEFRLPTFDGRNFDTRRRAGRVVLTTFVDTACREACPIIVSALARAVDRLSNAERARVVVVALSVDPEVDTPAHVRRFLRERHALGRVEYVVAPAHVMRPVWRAFHVLPAVDTGDADTHSADVRVFDRSGEWVATQHAGVDLSPANLVHDMRLAARSD
jgi:protein SCO1/2